MINHSTFFVFVNIGAVGMLLILTGFAFWQREQPMSTADIPPGYSSKLIDIKFREGTEVDHSEELLPPELKTSVARITPLFSLPKEQLDRMGSSRLKLWFRITLKPGTDAAAFVEDLKCLDSVEIVEPAPLPAPLP